MAETTPGKVTLRNTLSRPLTFRVEGKTVRLSPGEEMKVPETWLGAAELRHMCGAGHVLADVPQRRVDAAAPAAAAEDTPAAEASDTEAAVPAGDRKSGAKPKRKDQSES